jgi:hypothetical protein
MPWPRDPMQTDIVRFGYARRQIFVAATRAPVFVAPASRRRGFYISNLTTAGKMPAPQRKKSQHIDPP